jgi:hypothetical protein
LASSDQKLAGSNTAAWEGAMMSRSPPSSQNQLLKGLKLRGVGGVIYLRRSISPNFQNIKEDAGTRKSENVFSVAPWHEKALPKN